MSYPSQYGGGSSSSSNTPTSTPHLLEFLTAITSNTNSASQITQSTTQEDYNNNNQSIANQYSILTRCWRYERGSTLLLPYRIDDLIPIKNYIDWIEGIIIDKKISDEIQSGLHELELERLRYLYNDLHRIRLRKIELNPIYYAYDKQAKLKLSISELEFAKGYAKLVMNMMKEGFGDLPGQYGQHTVVFESPKTDEIALLHYLPKIPQERMLEVPNQIRPLYSNTVIIVPYEECSQWIQEGDFDVI